MEQKTISLKEHQKILLKMLKAFANFCDENNIKYFLHAGTLIGAVRHHGFIPWDNDIDIVMPRDDYNKLIELSEKITCIDKKYKIFLPEETIFTYLKMCDLTTKLIEYPEINPIDFYAYIDIHPMTLTNKGLIDDLTYLRSLFLIYFNWFLKFTLKKWSHGSFLYKTLSTIFNLIFKNKNYACSKQKAILDNYHKKNQNSKYYSIMDSTNRNIWKRCLFENTIDLKFEDTKFHSPSGYDEVLKIRYGDYMKIPKETEKYTHNNKITYRNK